MSHELKQAVENVLCADDERSCPHCKVIRRVLSEHALQPEAAPLFPPLAMVEWLQRWWKMDGGWRNLQRAQLGPDVAQLMRGVADMIEAPLEAAPSPQRPPEVKP